MVTLALASWIIGPAVGMFVLISVVLVLMVLIQKPQGGGLGGAFGASSGSGQTAFGAKTGDVLTLTTVSVFGIWLVGAVGLNFAVRPASATPPAAVMGASTAQPDDAGDGSSTADDATPSPDDGPPADAPDRPSSDTDEGSEAGGSDEDPGGGDGAGG